MDALVEKFEYEGYHGCESFCKVEIYGKNKLALVVMTELKNNPGTSVTNRSEAIASMVVTRYGLAPSRTLFIEHYDHNSYHGGNDKPTYSMVTYLWEGRRAQAPEWTYIKGEQFQTLLESIR